MTRRGITIRLALLPPLFVAVSALSFVLVQGPWAPDPVDRMVGLGATDEQRAVVRESLGLDQSLVERYARWLGGVATADLGMSWSGYSIRDEVAGRALASIELVVIGAAVAVAAGAALSAAATRGHGHRLGEAARWLSAAGGSVPDFLALLLLLLIPFDLWGYWPPLEAERPSFFDTPWENLRLFIPPGVVLGIIASRRGVRVWASAQESGPLRRGALSKRVLGAALASGPYLVGVLVIAESVLYIDGLGRGFLYDFTRQDLPLVHAQLTLLLFAAVAVSLFASGPGPARRIARIDLPARRSVALRSAIGTVLIGLFLAAAAVGPYFAPHAPNDVVAEGSIAGPSAGHPFGTDEFGRDVLSRVLYGARVELTFLVAIVVCAIALGLIVAAIADRLSPRTATRLSTMLLAWPLLPFVPLLVAIQFTRHDSTPLTVVVLAVLLVPLSLPLMHAALSRHRRGEEPWGIVRALRPLVTATLCEMAALAVVMHTTVDYFGLGGESSSGWGRSVAAGSIRYFHGVHYLPILAPGVAILLTVLGLYLMQDAFEDSADAASPATAPLLPPHPAPLPHAAPSAR